MTHRNPLMQKYSPQMASFFASKLAEIDKKVDFTKKELDSLLQEKKELTMLINDLKTPDGEYDAKWSVMRKISHFASDNWVTMLEIADKIKANEPNIDIKALKKSLSVVLSQDGGNKLVRRRNEKLEKFEYKLK
jgi:hypothetical protein